MSEPDFEQLKKDRDHCLGEITRIMRELENEFRRQSAPYMRIIKDIDNVLPIRLHMLNPQFMAQSRLCEEE